MNRFEGKNVLITGAGTGMGQAAALRLADEGAKLVLVGRRLEPLETLKAEIQAKGGEAIALSCDIGDESAFSRLIEKVVSTLGALDAVFANAGVLGEFQAAETISLEDFEALLNTNLKGTFITIKHALAALQQGAILINASWTANAVMPGSSAYASTKGALLAMMRVLAVEQGKHNIRVNAINPGIILTSMADEALDPAMAAKLADHTPLKRNGKPEDVAGTIAWLLSEDAAFVTGQEITVDGGYTLGGVRF